MPTIDNKVEEKSSEKKSDEKIMYDSGRFNDLGRSILNAPVVKQVYLALKSCTDFYKIRTIEDTTVIEMKENEYIEDNGLRHLWNTIKIDKYKRPLTDSSRGICVGDKLNYIKYRRSILPTCDLIKEYEKQSEK